MDLHTEDNVSTIHVCITFVKQAIHTLDPQGGQLKVYLGRIFIIFQGIFSLLWYKAYLDLRKSSFYSNEGEDHL